TGLRQQQAGWNHAQADGRFTPQGFGLAGEHRPGGGTARRLPLVRRASGSGKGLMAARRTRATDIYASPVVHEHTRGHRLMGGVGAPAVKAAPWRSKLNWD